MMTFFLFEGKVNEKDGNHQAFVCFFLRVKHGNVRRKKSLKHQVTINSENENEKNNLEERAILPYSFDDGAVNKAAED